MPGFSLPAICRMTATTPVGAAEGCEGNLIITPLFAASGSSYKDRALSHRQNLRTCLA
jgi:hypothetical protein